MVKPALDRPIHPKKVVADLLLQYGFVTDGDDFTFVTLQGGFSGTNFCVTLPKRTPFCLKICHGYDRHFVESQARVQEHLKLQGYKKACFPLPLAATAKPLADDQFFQFATIDPMTEDPVIAMTFVEGTAADSLLEKGLVDMPTVFEKMGESLAQLHTVPVRAASLRTFKYGGACDVWKQMQGDILSTLEASEYTKDHPFMDFYRPRQKHLAETMKKVELLPRGVIHGDPFVDNIMLDPKTGAVNAWIDWEDATVGPVLFDVACCIIGTCFPEGEQQLNMDRFRFLMAGYTRGRPLHGEEVSLLVDFCRLALLCNCSWRFSNFYISHREMIECRDKYIELRDRIVDLESSATEAMIRESFLQLDETSGKHVVFLKDVGVSSLWPKEADHYLGKDHTTNCFSADLQPALRVRPGDRIHVQTWDCFHGKVQNVEDFAKSDVWVEEELNPATGPIYIEGAQPGDTLSVKILDIRTEARGAAMFSKNFGHLGSLCKPETYGTFFDVSNGIITMKENPPFPSAPTRTVSWPASPMLGVIGVAPEAGRILTMPAGKHGGNLDNNMNKIGSTVYLPVKHPGALLGIGDMHASMGDGEICGTGVEIGGDTLIQVDLIKGIQAEFPITETSDSWITHGVHHGDVQGDIQIAMKHACEEAAHLLVKYWGFSYEDAFIFLGVTSDLGVAQCCHPAKGTVIAKMRVPKLDICPRPFGHEQSSQ